MIEIGAMQWKDMFLGNIMQFISLHMSGLVSCGYTEAIGIPSISAV